MKHSHSRLQPRSRLASASLVLALLASLPSAFAITQYWDPGLTGSGTAGGTGTWAAATANWWNGSSDTTLTATNVAGFAGAGGTVSLTNTAVAAGGLSIESNGYVIGDGTNTWQINISAQAATDGISVAPGVTGTIIDVGGIRLGSVGSGTAIQLTNTDLIDFKNTTVYLSGSRTTRINNSSASATTANLENVVVAPGPTPTWRWKAATWSCTRSLPPRRIPRPECSGPTTAPPWSTPPFRATRREPSR